MLKLLIAMVLFIYASTNLHASDFQIQPNQHQSLFNLSHKTVPIISTKFTGWDDGWKWAKTKTYSATVSSSSFTGEIKSLDIKFEGESRLGSHSSWDYTFNVSQNHPKAIGYGIEFKLNTRSPSFHGKASDPEILADKTGWQWRISDKEVIKVKFTSPLAKLYFERGNKYKIQALFFGPIQTGTYPFTMQLSINGVKSIDIAETNTPSKEQLKNWQRNTIPWNSSPVDLSHLNDNHKPAGKHGMLKAEGDSLFFQDGTPAKFWGTNIQASALFKTTDANIKKQAKRLSRLGFNLVRIHHHDSSWVKPNIFTNPKHDTQTLNPSSLKKLDWWIKCLKDEGIYIWLDLQVGRAYTAHDGIEHFDEVAKNKNTHLLRGFNYYNESIQQRMMDFNQSYLSHINQFTDISYKDEPAIVSTLIINENDLTRHFANRLLPDKKVPEHNKLYNQDVKQASKRLRLNHEQSWRSWEYGDSKIYLNDAEHRFNKKMLSHLKQIGVKNTLVTGNTWGGMALASLPSLTDSDIIDVHSYGRKNELLFNPRYRAGLLSWIGAGQVTNKPLSVTEWNVEKFPVSDRFTIPTWLASIASLQGWDSLMLYGYSQTPLNKSGKGSNYSTFNDPALMAMMPASALLYRQDHVSLAKNTFHIRLNKKDFFGKRITPANSATLRTLTEQSKISIDLPYSQSLPWLKPHAQLMSASYSENHPNHHIVTDPDIDFIPAAQSNVNSDTNELSRDWIKGIQTINTSKSQIISGKIGKQVLSLADVTFEITTLKATVAVQSLDDLPIRLSNNILISRAARSKPIKSKFSAFKSEPVAGKLIIKAPTGLTLYQVNSDKEKPIKTTFDEQGYHIVLDEKNSSPWLYLKASE
jgi:hypothetical protein